MVLPIRQLILPRTAWLVVLCLLSACTTTSRSAEPPVVGAAAPTFALPQLDGTTVDLADLHGKVVIVNFWATWCAPCIEETPRLIQWREQHQAEGLEVLGVDALVRDSREAVEAFVQQYGVTYPIVLDEEGGIVAQWLAQQMPRSYVLDRDGVVRYVRIGGLTEKDFAQHIQPLLAVY